VELANKSVYLFSQDGSEAGKGTSYQRYLPTWSKKNKREAKEKKKFTFLPQSEA
jgi:hypothetical protein